MAQWPQNPTWTPSSGINAGQQYQTADGLTASDMVAIVENILYLYSRPVQTPKNDGEWDITKDYNALDTVYHAGSSYMALINVPAADAVDISDTRYWMLLASAGAPGPQGAPGAKGDKGDTGESGVYVGSTEPTDPNQNVWIDPNGSADYNDKFELIEEITLTENVASIVREAEPDGTAYNFQDIFVQVDIPMGDYGYTSVYHNISFITANNNTMTVYSTFKPTASYNSRYNAFGYIRNGNLFAECSDSTLTYGSFPNGSSDPATVKRKGYLLLDESHIANIRIWTRDEQKLIPSGTKITIYGVRA